MGSALWKPPHSSRMALPMRKAPAMKTAMKGAMKAMKAKKVSKVAKGKYMRAAVFSGKKGKTISQLTKADLIKNKRGKIVTKKQSALGKKRYSQIKGWVEAVQKARKNLGVKGFVAIKKGSALYKAAKELYSA